MKNQPTTPRALLPLVAITALLLPHAEAGTRMVSDKRIVATISSPFDAGKLELQSATGAYYSVGHSSQPTLNYSSSSLRLGVMLNSPSGDGWMRGNWEPMIQLFGGSSFEGPHGSLGGAALVLRYNFVQPDARWVPYVQIGVGAVYNNIYKDHAQRSIGQAWELDLEAVVGIRYFFCESWSANLEGGYRNIANMGMNDRDVGLNSLGAGIGLGYHF